MDVDEHRTLTIEQFSRQAVPFAKLPGHSSAIEVLERLACPRDEDELLDVACGPGLVACHFAPLVRRVTGLDLTPEMISQAKALQGERKIDNAEWMVGEAAPLPFAAGTFSLVLTRYSFHHFRAPSEVMAEMVRVCRPGGRVVVADVSLPAEKVAAYDELELLRDPSHVHALSRDEFAEAFAGSGLGDVRFAEYKVDFALEDQLAASFPVEGGAEKIRAMMRQDVGVDRLGVNARDEDGVLRYTVPIVVGVGTKAP